MFVTLSDTTCNATSASTVTINAVPLAPSTPVVTVTQPTCASPSGTIVFTTQAGAEYSIGGAYQASPTFSGLVPGTYILSIRNTSDTSCETIGSTITINPAQTPPVTPTTTSVTQPTCAVPTGTIVFNTQAGVEYSIGGTYQASATFSGVLPGTYTLSVHNSTDNTCTTNGFSTVTINGVPTAPATPTVASVTQPTCAIPTGTIVFQFSTRCFI